MTTDLSDAAWLKDGPVAGLLALLDQQGEQARIVGGAVRNALLGEPLHEFDIATTAVPAEVERRARAAGLKTVPTGIDHGTVTVIIDGHPFEVTTLREDVETFGRKATVAFGRDWKADAERRDFTINALSVSRDGRLHDYVGGLADLKQRHVRFIGDPARRIAEDYLRILRFFRFHAAYGEGSIDAEGLLAVIAARDGLASLSRERIGMEISKLMFARGAVATLALMTDIGLLIDVLGGVVLVAAFANMVEIERALLLPADPIRRLGTLAAQVSEDAGRIATRLRLSNADRDRLDSLVTRWHEISADIDDQTAKALLYRLKPDRYLDRVAYAWARSTNDRADPRWQALATLPQRWMMPECPLRASDFMARGLARGPALGTALRAAEEAWIAAGFPVERAAIGAILDRIVDVISR